MPIKYDLTGNKYGHLTVLRQVNGTSRYTTWECKCDCGNTVNVDSRHLRSGLTTSCGCSEIEHARSKRGRKPTDLTGEVFGKLTVLERVENKGKMVVWKCRCACGQLTLATAHDLKNGSKRSCGCLRKENCRRKDIAGKRFGKLVALYPMDKLGVTGSVIWKCRCDCGNEVEVAVADLNKGNNKSCGCLKIKYQHLVRERLHLVDGTCIEWLDGRKSRLDNTSGFRGVYKKKSGKYSVSIGFKKKIYYIGTYEEYDDAVEARLRAENLIHDGFVKAHDFWAKKAQEDPEWAGSHPFHFDVKKENGSLIIRNSVEELMEAERKAELLERRNSLLKENELVDAYTDSQVPRFIEDTEENGTGTAIHEDKEKQFVHI